MRCLHGLRFVTESSLNSRINLKITWSMSWIIHRRTKFRTKSSNFLLISMPPPHFMIAIWLKQTFRGHFTAKFSSRRPHFSGVYETMNVWQMFISVSDSSVAANGYESSAWLPGTSSEYSYHGTFCFDSTKTFSFPRPHWAPPVVCLSPIWGYLGSVFRSRFAAYWFHFDCEYILGGFV